MNLNLMAFVETGVCYRLSPGINLYTGIYAGYGFNNLYPHDKKNYFYINKTEIIFKTEYGIHT